MGTWFQSCQMYSFLSNKISVLILQSEPKRKLPVGGKDKGKRIAIESQRKASGN